MLRIKLNYKLILLLSILAGIALPLTATASSFTTNTFETPTANNGLMIVGSASYNSFFFAYGGQGANGTATGDIPSVTYNAYQTSLQNSQSSVFAAAHSATLNASSAGNSISDSFSFKWAKSPTGSSDAMVGLASTLAPANVITTNSAGVNAGNTITFDANVPAIGDTGYILAGTSAANIVFTTLPSGCTEINAIATNTHGAAGVANCIFSSTGLQAITISASTGTKQAVTGYVWVFNTPTAVLGTLTANNPYFGNNIHTSLNPQVNSNAMASAGAITYQWYSNTASNVGCTTTNAIAGATSANYIFSITKTTWFAYNAIDASTNQGSVCSNSIQAVDPTIASFPTLPATMIVGQRNISVSATWTAYSGMGSTSGTSQVINFLAYNSLSGVVVTNTLITVSNTALSANIVFTVNALWQGNTIAFNAIIGNTLNPSQVFTGNIEILTVLGSIPTLFSCAAPLGSQSMTNGEPISIQDPSNIIGFSMWGSNSVAFELMASLGAQPYLFNASEPLGGIGYVSVSPVPNGYDLVAIYNSTTVPEVIHYTCDYFVSGIGVLGESTVHGLVSASGVNSIAATTTAPNTLALGNSLIATTLTGVNSIITTQTGTNAYNIGNSVISGGSSGVTSLDGLTGVVTIGTENSITNVINGQQIDFGNTLISTSLSFANSITGFQTGTNAWTIGNTVVSCPSLTAQNSIQITQTGCYSFLVGNTPEAFYLTLTQENSIIITPVAGGYQIGNTIISSSGTTYTAGNGLILTGSTFSVNALPPLTSTAAGLGLSTTTNFSIHNGQLDFKAFSCVFLVCSLSNLYGNLILLGAGNAVISNTINTITITVTGSGSGTTYTFQAANSLWDTVVGNVVMYGNYPIASGGGSSSYSFFAENSLWESTVGNNIYYGNYPIVGSGGGGNNICITAGGNTICNTAFTFASPDNSLVLNANSVTNTITSNQSTNPALPFIIIGAALLILSFTFRSDKKEESPFIPYLKDFCILLAILFLLGGAWFIMIG